MTGEQTTTKDSQPKGWLKQLWEYAWAGIVGDVASFIGRHAWQLIGAAMLPIILWIQPFWQGFLPSKFVFTGQEIALTGLLVLGLAVMQPLSLAWQRRLLARKHEQVMQTVLAGRDQQIADLKGQLINQERLFSLISKHELGIVFVTYGVDGLVTKDVTGRVISELDEKGEVFIDNDLVGGEEHDPARYKLKESEVTYYLGKPFSKKVPENSKLSIADLIQNAKDSKPRVALNNRGLTKETIWKPLR